MSSDRRTQSYNRRRTSSPFPDVSAMASQYAHRRDHPYTFREMTKRRRTLMIDNVRSDLTDNEILNIVAPCSVLRMHGRFYEFRPHLQSLQITFSETCDVQQVMNIRPFGQTNYQDLYPVIYNRINEFTMLFGKDKEGQKNDKQRTWRWKRQQYTSSSNKQVLDLAERLYRQTRASEEKVHYKKLKQRVFTNRYNVPVLESSNTITGCSSESNSSRRVSPVDSLFQYYLDENEPSPPATIYQSSS